MIFTDLFLGGPAVLEKGLRLCAANGINIPFTALELKRLRWTLPYAGLPLCVYSLPDSPQGEALLKMCNLQFDAWIKSLVKTVRLGDYVVTQGELRALRDSGVLSTDHSSDIRDAQIELSVLSGLLADFRFEGIRMILERFQQRHRYGGLSLDQDYDRIGAIAHAVGCLVFGREPDDNSLEQKFVIDAVAETQKHIDVVLERYTTK